MMTAKYCPRSEIKKLEIEIWNLKVKGTDVVSYAQHFQELALMCGRMFLEESDEVEKYVGGLPDMIQGSVMASKPKKMQDAIYNNPQNFPYVIEQPMAQSGIELKDFQIYYFPASPGNTPSDSSDDLTKYLLASLAISPFHDDPYMKVMQAYDATNNESPIPLLQAPITPLIILPPSPVLPISPMFDPRDFFLPEEILPSQKRACSRSSSSTSALLQVFEIGESSYKTHLEHHEEHIETILNHLDELPLKRIENNG
ncbi:hypothetical protein Tco_0053640 [Tanacetum coccineum]